ncbi:DnaJ domain-containing protein, partial [Cupriavidus sp. HPC(L)]|uniref:DnaJ domain-containing protein n=2 Tax=Cupriavidus TaxID=106589 RepID=UPI0012EE918E
MTHHDHYQTLGVAPTATADEIRQAYRRLAMRWHPDRNPDDPQAAEERFKRLQHAFAVLKDAGRRMAYDAERAAPRGGSGHGGGNGAG